MGVASTSGRGYTSSTPKSSRTSPGMGVLEGKKGMPKYSVRERTKLAAMAWMWETIH